MLNEPDPGLWPNEVSPGDVEVLESYGTVGTVRVMLIRQPSVGHGWAQVVIEMWPGATLAVVAAVPDDGLPQHRQLAGFAAMAVVRAGQALASASDRPRLVQ